MKPLKKQRISPLLLAFYVTCQIEAYCSGVTVPSQVEIVADEARTTASAKEQK
jgi:hypothetical protein